MRLENLRLVFAETFSKSEKERRRKGGGRCFGEKRKSDGRGGWGKQLIS